MAYNITEQTAAAIRATAAEEGREHCDSILYAFRMGYMIDTSLTVDAFVEEYGETHGEMQDILPDIVPAAWAEWQDAGDVESMSHAWNLYVAFFAEGFIRRAYAPEANSADAIGNG